MKARVEPVVMTAARPLPEESETQTAPKLTLHSVLPAGKRVNARMPQVTCYGENLCQ